MAAVRYNHKGGCMRRLACICAGVLAMAAPAYAAPGGHSNHSQGNAGTSGTFNQPQPLSTADQNSGGANGQCPGGKYCSTRNGSPSLNGQDKGQAVGRPCAGCVGKADNKNPPGQLNNTHSNGYECNGNQGIGKTNPAHTGCQQVTVTPTTPPTTPTTPPTKPKKTPKPTPSPTPTPGHHHHHPTPTPTPTPTPPSPFTPPAKPVPFPTSGVPSVPTTQITPTSSTGQLPFTGMDVGLAVLIGLGMIGSGIALRRRITT